MKLRTIVLQAILAVYLYFLIKIILFKGHSANVALMTEQLKIGFQEPARILTRIKQGNLIPLHEITSALNAGTGHSSMNLYGNFLIFVPLGLLLAALGARKGTRSAKNVLAISFFLSLALEMSQAIFSIGSFDVDDLILNTAGGMAGCALYALFAKAGRKKADEPDYESDTTVKSS